MIMSIPKKRSVGSQDKSIDANLPIVAENYLNIIDHSTESQENRTSSGKYT